MESVDTHIRRRGARERGGSHRLSAIAVRAPAVLEGRAGLGSDSAGGASAEAPWEREGPRALHGGCCGRQGRDGVALAGRAPWEKAFHTSGLMDTVNSVLPGTGFPGVSPTSHDWFGRYWSDMSGRKIPSE